MKNKLPQGLFLIGIFVTVAVTSVCAQTTITKTVGMPGPRPKVMKTLTGLVRVPKAFGVVPAGPGLNQGAALPCAPFYVAVLDPDKNNKTVAVTDGLLEPGREDDIFYTCKYSVSVPADKRLYAIAGMGGPSQLPLGSRWPMYITDAWVGGSNNKPRRGYERGFAGKFVTLGNKDMYLRFDLYYAQVDPN